jgi:hypothetical protein
MHMNALAMSCHSLPLQTIHTSSLRPLLLLLGCRGKLLLPGMRGLYIFSSSTLNGL